MHINGQAVVFVVHFSDERFNYCFKRDNADCARFFAHHCHALHGFLSDVKYPTLAGTNVPADFVEYPSQQNEMWAREPAVLAHFAKDYRTGKPMTEAINRFLAEPELAAKMGAMARKEAERHYAMSDVAREIAGLYLSAKK